MMKLQNLKTVAAAALSLAMLSSLAGQANAASTQWTGHCDLPYDGGKFSVTADLWFTPEGGNWWSPVSSVNFQNVNIWVVPYVGKGTTIPELEQFYVDIHGRPNISGNAASGQMTLGFFTHKRSSLSLYTQNTIPVNDIEDGPYSTQLTIRAKPKGQEWTYCKISKVLGQLWDGT